MAPDIDDIIKNCIEEIWNQYDDDESGYLDKEECFNFIIDSFDGLGALIKNEESTSDYERNEE